MSSFEEDEMPAVKAAGVMGGEYLDSIEKYDLSELSKAEWETFVSCICREYHRVRKEFHHDR